MFVMLIQETVQHANLKNWLCVNNPKGVVGRNQTVRTDRTVHVEETVKRNKKSKCHVLC